jgi:hypothetical protein
MKASIAPTSSNSVAAAVPATETVLSQKEKVVTIAAGSSITFSPPLGVSGPSLGET